MDRYYVYIIESLTDGTLYKGFTSNYIRRLQEHNLGLSRYTRHKAPWKLIYVEPCASKAEALIREKQLKRYNRGYIGQLCKQDRNLLNNIQA